MARSKEVETSFFVIASNCNNAIGIFFTWEEETPPDLVTKGERLGAGVKIERLAGSFDSLEVAAQEVNHQDKNFRPRGYR